MKIIDLNTERPYVQQGAVVFENKAEVRMLVLALLGRLYGRLPWIVRRLISFADIEKKLDEALRALAPEIVQ